MKLHQLLYFLEAAKQEHVGRAAKVLAISPSAISHGIAALEDELGRELFSKKGKNIRITEHGKLLVERAKSLLLDVERIREEISSEDVELQGAIKMAGSHLLTSELMVPAWVEIQKEHPKLFGELYTVRSASVHGGVCSGAYDFGVCFSPQSSPDVEMETIYEGQLVLAVRKGHSLVKMSRQRVASKLSQLPAVLPKSFQGIDNCETHPVFKQFGIEPRVEMAFDSYDVAIEKVKLSDSWTFLPDWVAQRRGLSSIVLEGWNAPMSIAALWPAGRIQTRLVRMLLDKLKFHASRH